jgi:hypothetical protein
MTVDTDGHFSRARHNEYSLPPEPITRTFRVPMTT